jgi:hypothetical protein
VVLLTGSVSRMARGELSMSEDDRGTVEYYYGSQVISDQMSFEKYVKCQYPGTLSRDLRYCVETIPGPERDCGCRLARGGRRWINGYGDEVSEGEDDLTGMYGSSYGRGDLVIYRR